MNKHSLAPLVRAPPRVPGAIHPREERDEKTPCLVSGFGDQAERLDEVMLPHHQYTTHQADTATAADTHGLDQGDQAALTQHGSASNRQAGNLARLCLSLP